MDGSLLEYRLRWDARNQAEDELAATAFVSDKARHSICMRAEEIYQALRNSSLES